MWVTESARHAIDRYYCLEVILISSTKCCWHCCWHCWFNWSFMTKPNRACWALEKHKQPESTHRPKQRKRLRGTLMINQRRSYSALFDCVARSTSWMRLPRQLQLLCYVCPRPILSSPNYLSEFGHILRQKQYGIEQETNSSARCLSCLQSPFHKPFL